MNKLSPAERAQVVRCLVEGNSVRSTVRIAGVARNTVAKLLIELGAACSDYQDRIMRDLKCRRLQADEIWTFCYCKQRNLTPEIAEQTLAGDIWTRAVIDTDTKLVPCWVLGRRDAATATEFIQDLAGRLSHRVQLTTDGLRVYLNAVIDAFADDADYAILHKIYGAEPAGEARYSPAKCTGCERWEVLGEPDLEHISTSVIERQKLTMRMGVRRFTRLTNGFSKKIENLGAAVALHFMFYNFARIHQTLKTTPAVAAGISDHVWSVEEIISLLDSSSNAARSNSN